MIQDPRAVARGNFGAVLVAARDAPMGGVMLHNHPTGSLEPSDADMRIAGQLYDQGVGTVIVIMLLWICMWLLSHPSSGNESL
ncbi:MAG: hypothetical protein Ct9H300mP15_08510 [Gemmatimonadota bacterium]|nr:MAG: hypothetical protein Ct9H300mP15_08510 [Gemmatimonadota bacterium]